jgi:xanthine dehydrogenase accessory factor
MPMESVDHEVLRKAVSWLRDGQPVTLAMIVRASGSIPRPLGALLAVRADGAFAGSISGGCVEEDLVERVVAGEFKGLPQTVRYGEAESGRNKLPCGTTLELLVEPVHQQESLESVLIALERQDLVARRVHLPTGEVLALPAQPGATLEFDGVTATRLFGPQWRLFIIGAAQVSRYLASIAQALDYHVIVCDPREEYAASWDVEGCEFTREMPDDVVQQARLDSRSAVVALSHDARIDDLALMEALKSDAFYVGALGSKANNAKRRERLAEFDLTPEQLARLRGPVGLPIGSRTPPELAIAILAELTAIRNNIAVPAESRPERTSAHA